MTPISLIALIPGSYFNAVLVCYFAYLTRNYGLFPEVRTAIRLLWPPFRAILIGFVPGAFLSNAVGFFMNAPPSVEMLPVALGGVVSGLVLHRNLRGLVENGRRWNVAIATIFALILPFLVPLLYFLPTPSA